MGSYVAPKAVTVTSQAVVADVNEGERMEEEVKVNDLLDDVAKL